MVATDVLDYASTVPLAYFPQENSQTTQLARASFGAIETTLAIDFIAVFTNAHSCLTRRR